MFKIKSLQFLIDESVRTFKRFPLVLISGIAAAAFSMYYAEIDKDVEYVKPVFTFLLGLPLFLGLTLFLEAKNINRPLIKTLTFAGGIALLVAYHFTALGDSTTNYFFRYAQLSLALHLFVSFAAHTTNPDEADFWETNKTFFMRILTSFVYAAAFFLGLVAAIVTTSKLFAFEIKGVRYAELFFFSSMVFQTWHFLAGLPAPRSAPTPTAYPRSLKYFIQYLLIPLVSLYTLILYVYMLKILITNAWPEGYVGWLVSIMSVLGILNLLLIHPEKFRPENKWLVSYSKYYYILILPLLMMLFIAIGKRISEYGITERRYFLLVLGLWLFAVALYFTFSRAKKIKVIPVSLFVVALITAWGPLSSYNISLRNQIARANEILTRNHISTEKAPDAAGAVATRQVSREDQGNLSSIFDYILRYHGPDYLDVWFNEETLQSVRPADSKIRYTNSESLMRALGLTYYSSNEMGTQYFNFNSKTETTPYKVMGYTYLIRIDTETEIENENRKIKVILNSKTNKIEFSENEQPITQVDLNPLLEKLQTAEFKKNTEMPREHMTLRNETEPFKFTIFLDNITGNYKEEKAEVTHISGWLLFR